jgi:D-alanyl-D-alanine carboxypeptidase (penicillin-binding protein 5/6)
MADNTYFTAFLKPVAIGLCAAFALTAIPAEARSHSHGKQAAAATSKKAAPKPAGDGAAQKPRGRDLRSSASINAETGEILECNPAPEGCFDKRAPASTTKLMTAMIVFDALRSGKLHLQDRHPLVPIGASADDGGQGAVALQRKTLKAGKKTIFAVPVGTQLTVDTLLSAVAVSSAADATMTLSTAICGTSDCIVDLMNQKLAVIFKDNPHGLHTNFANAHGMPNRDQYTAAYDQAVIGAYLGNNYYKEATTYFSQTSYEANGYNFPGHNRMLVNYTCTNSAFLPYKCMEFGKTGFFRTPEPGGLPAMFCITAVAARNGYRVSGSTLGYPSDAARNTEEARVLNSAFTQLERRHAPTLPKGRPMPLHFPSLTPDPTVEPEPDQSGPLAPNTPALPAWPAAAVPH